MLIISVRNFSMEAHMIDFTNCRIIPGRAYNGANGSKVAVNYENAVYMIKFPPSVKNKPTALSYSNSCVSEHLASSIYNIIGIPAQETMLGTYTVNGKQKLVCACRDFTVGDKRLFDFCSMKNTVFDSESSGTGTELSDILDAMDKQSYILPSTLHDFFWNMFVVDALLGNFDRHNGNWGFLYNEATDETEIAPVFDCGSCLLPQADEKTLKKVLYDEKELHARIFQFPTSAIQLNGRKINYYDFLTGASNAECNAAVLRIVPMIDMGKIMTFIMDTEGIPDLQKDFYCRYLDARYNLILIPSYEYISAST